MSRSSPEEIKQEVRENLARPTKAKDICERCKLPLTFCNHVTMTYKKRVVDVCVSCAAKIELLLTRI